jgi:hypothetical protein
MTERSHGVRDMSIWATRVGFRGPNCDSSQEGGDRRFGERPMLAWGANQKRFGFFDYATVDDSLPQKTCINIPGAYTNCPHIEKFLSC